MSSTLPILETDSVPAGTGERCSPHATPGILDVPIEALRGWLAERNHPPMRINQIRKQILANRATAFEDMSDLPKGLRADLAGTHRVFSMSVERHFAASDDTHKLVLRLADGRMIEAVLIQDDGRATACISTQVGCGMGCVFCASGLNGVVRNLTAGEMVEQLVLLRNLTDANTTNPGRAQRLTHIVVMGMGEPLANLDNLLDALAVAGDKNGLGIGARHVTISTVGLPAKIRKLAESGKQYHLAVSLHAPNDELRTRIVPTNDKVGMDAILAAADEFYEKTGRQVTYEYVVLGGLNDQAPHARQLAGLLHGRRAHVNLIPWNAVEGLPFKRPAEADLQYLIDTLRRSGISVKVRKRKGSEIDAACGQLRRQAEAALGGERSQ
ncbi:23S rRNA (adenine(2503)-C(2))-methyltransferase RlmN [Gemmata sp. JC673]|uniref:Probable dual-specificity RNA methyltransferase RlmN n=1 Tax=Gemmata algarum TaxID=2975278 RepID=A0ABU5ER59_9BACT|nr:23S rRNA (adenine(2503)-C(2))-methyltransferase RlmN [Gemmata algarum]MDY3557645.1 23S rRNA (adenine(2503)-C(2))-methyltransferase RlmN [Gemmata algarum]